MGKILNETLLILCSCLSEELIKIGIIGIQTKRVEVEIGFGFQWNLVRY